MQRAVLHSNRDDVSNNLFHPHVALQVGTISFCYLWDQKENHKYKKAGNRKQFVGVNNKKIFTEGL
jgi:hypothetical protein